MDNHKIKIISGSSHPALAREIALHLGTEAVENVSTHFSDGEIQVDLGQSVRGFDVYVVQSLSSSDSHSVNDNLVELMIIIDALKRASAESINIVLPYYGYARQDRKVGTRTPITAKLIADILQSAGAKRILTLDLHSDQIQGFYNIPVENLNATKLIADYIAQKDMKDVVVVSPDAGGTKRARKMASLLDNAPLVVIDKRRPEANKSEVMHILGEVEGKIAVILDDMIDTAGTITNAAAALIEKGAKDVYIAATHGVLSGPAVERIQASGVKEIILCDTITIPDEKQMVGLVVLPVSKLLSEAIERIHHDKPLSPLIEF